MQPLQGFAVLVRVAVVNNIQLIKFFPLSAPLLLLENEFQNFVSFLANW